MMPYLLSAVLCAELIPLSGAQSDAVYRSKFGVKESQSLARIPDTLVYAMEFITMATPPEQQKALDDLRLEVLRSHSELKVPLDCWQTCS